MIGSPPKVKTCCIKNEKEAKLAIRAGASAVGLVSEMPSGPGVIPLDDIARIAATVPNHVDTFLLTSKQTAEEIIDQHAVCNTSTIQIVDEVAVGTHRKLREKLPGIKLVQVIHVTDQSTIDTARKIAPKVDALLLDSGNPSLNIKELGGTGRTHNWQISRQIVEAVSVPVYLAGGLNPGNIQQAIQAVKPFGIDVCSGLRSAEKLDPDKTNNFFAKINALFSSA